MSEITYRQATREDLEAIREHFNAAFHGSRSSRVQEWKYTPKPWAQSDPIGIVALRDDQVVGFYGSLPWQIVVNGHVIGVAQPCDVSVAEELRGEGLNQGMFEHFSRCRAEFGRLGFGFPNAVALSIGQQKLGYTIQTGTRVYGRATAPLEYLPGVVNHSDEVPDSWFPFCDLAAREIGISTYRSLEFLRWRYTNLPGRDFGFLTSRQEGNVIGTLAYQLTPHGLRIFDWLAGDSSTYALLLSRLVDRYPHLPITHGCTETAPYIDQLEALGFTLAESGSLVTCGLTEAGEHVSDGLAAFARSSGRWFATWTDTDH